MCYFQNCFYVDSGVEEGEKKAVLMNEKVGGRGDTLIDVGDVHR